MSKEPGTPGRKCSGVRLMAGEEHGRTTTKSFIAPIPGNRLNGEQIRAAGRAASLPLTCCCSVAQNIAGFATLPPPACYLFR